MRARRTHRHAAAGALAFGLALAACGGSDTDFAVPVVAPTPTAPVRDADPLTPVAFDETSGERAAAPEPDPSPGGADAAGDPSVIVPASTTTPDTAPVVTTTPAIPQATLPPPAEAPRTPADPFFGSSVSAFGLLARTNPAASITVVSGGTIVYSDATGVTVDGQPATGDSPMVVASVSKLIVAVGISRLNAAGLLDVSGPVPWTDIGLAPHAAWNDVTIRELLDHRSGLSKARSSWFTGEGTCRDHIPSLLTTAPNPHRGSWVYSNGNYCLLGLIVEQRTGLPLDQALQQLVFDPIGAGGIHLTDGGLQPGDLPYAPGPERLSRLGGAGTLMVSTDDIALLIGRLTLDDRAVLLPPGVFTDQYGFGHTGTVDGAKSCVWVLDGGATVVAATVAGDGVGSGGGVCDIVVPAVATDLGIGQGPPDRTP